MSNRENENFVAVVMICLLALFVLVVLAGGLASVGWIYNVRLRAAQLEQERLAAKLPVASEAARLQAALAARTQLEARRDVTLDVDKEGVVKLADRKVPQAELLAHLERLQEKHALPLRLTIRAAGATSFATVRQVMAAAQEAGIDDVALQTSDE